MLGIRENSEKKYKLISKLEEDILNLRNTNLSLSRSSNKIITPKHSQSISEKTPKTNCDPQ